MNKKIPTKISKPKSKEHYVNNAQLLASLNEWKKECIDAENSGEQTPKVPEYVGECIIKIATRLSLKPNFSNYTFRDDMILDGVENCIQYIHNFNPKKSTNPFSYFTQIIYFAFLRRIMKEKKQAYIKNKLILNLPPELFAILDENNETNNLEAFIDFMKKNRNFDDWMEKRKIARKMKKNIEQLGNDEDEDSNYN